MTPSDEYIQHDDNAVLQEESFTALRILLPRNWIIRPKDPDRGIDKEIHIVEGTNITEKFLWAQVKGTACTDTPDASVTFSIKTKHLKHYERCPLPVLILRWVKSDDAFYQLFAQRHIREVLSVEDREWRSKKTKTLHFPPGSRLTKKNVEDTLNRLAVDGYLYVLQHQLEDRAGGGPVYWLDGIPTSDNEELKERIAKALAFDRDAKYPDAIREYEDILRCCALDPDQRMSVLLNFGIAHHRLCQYDASLRNYNAILDITKKADRQNAPHGRAAALGNIGLIHRDRGKLDEAMRCYEESLKIKREIGDRQGEARSLCNIGLIYGEKGDLDESMRCLKESLKIAREIGDRQGEASSLGNIGVIHRLRWKLDQAMRCQKKSLKIAREIGDRHVEAHNLGNIGVIHQERGKLDQAMRFYEESLKISREIGNRQGEANSLSNIGLIHEDKREFNEALRSLEAALALYDEHGFADGRDETVEAIARIKKRRDEGGEATPQT